MNIADVPIKHQQNLEELKDKMNVIRAMYGKPMNVTSGYRSMQDHLRIYSTINQKRKANGQAPLQVPLGSKHLYGQQVDIYDPKQELQEWVQKNVQVLETLGLYCEDFQYTKNWVHFQSVPPKSGKRFFIP